MFVFKQRADDVVVRDITYTIDSIMPQLIRSQDRDVIDHRYRVFKHPSHEIDAGCIVHVRFDEVPGSYDMCVNAICDVYGVEPDLVHIQDEWLKICKLEVGERIHPHVDLFNDCTLSCMIPLTQFEGGKFRLVNKVVDLAPRDVIVFNRALEHEIELITSGTALVAFTGFKLLM